MQRSGWLLGAVAAAGVTTSVVLYLQKRGLEDELARARAAAPAAVAPVEDPWRADDDGPEAAARPLAVRRVPVPHSGPTEPPPQLPPPKQETRLERRVRRRHELAALLGRLDGETAAEYKARITPLIKTALARPRAQVEDLRRQVEARAGVTAEQHARLDAAFADVDAELLDLTNKAIGDGDLTPYRSNVAGVLQYAGGLGAILDSAQGRIGQILSPAQLRVFDDSGFEWAEYLGVLAPWEQLDAPPPPP